MPNYKLIKYKFLSTRVLSSSRYSRTSLNVTFGFVNSLSAAWLSVNLFNPLTLFNHQVDIPCTVKDYVQFHLDFYPLRKFQCSVLEPSVYRLCWPSIWLFITCHRGLCFCSWHLYQMRLMASEGHRSPFYPFGFRQSSD